MISINKLTIRINNPCETATFEDRVYADKSTSILADEPIIIKVEEFVDSAS